jgi:hypothetical protein
MTPQRSEVEEVFIIVLDRLRFWEIFWAVGKKWVKVFPEQKNGTITRLPEFLEWNLVLHK